MAIMTSVEKKAAIGGLVLLAALLVGSAIVIEMEGDTDQPPFGCAWVDVDPSKTSDYRLACAEGYGP
jgi:hypothetical protein